MTRRRQRKQPRPQAFLIVGHSSWGKSRTLKSLTGESTKPHYWTIAGQELFMRRMSNDDDDAAFADIVEGLDPGTQPRVLLAYCPKACPDEQRSVKALARRYDIFAYVLRYSHRGEVMGDREVRHLRDLGTVEFYERRAEAPRRARALRRFIRANLR